MVTYFWHGERESARPFMTVFICLGRETLEGRSRTLVTENLASRSSGHRERGLLRGL